MSTSRIHRAPAVFEIVEEIEDVGEDIIVSSADPDEATCWIEHQLEEFES